MSPEDMIVALPHLNLSQVHDALANYYEYESKIDEDSQQAIKKKRLPSHPWRKNCHLSYQLVTSVY